MSSTESKCFYCVAVFPTNGKGTKRYNSHLGTHHCESVEFRNKKTQQLLASCNRSDPNSNIACFDLSCDQTFANSQSLVLHVNKVHLSGSSVITKIIPFPSTHSSLSRVSALDIDADDEAGSTTSIADTPSENDESVAGSRMPRSLTHHNRFNPLASRSPSPHDHSRQSSPNRPASPIIPSPLAQVAFSRPASPSDHSKDSNSDVDMSPTSDTGVLDKTTLIIIPATFHATVPRHALVCTATRCGCAINPTPDKVFAHLRTHSISLTTKEQSTLKAYLERHTLLFAFSSIMTERPDRNSAPLQGLIQYEGFICLLCDHATTTLTSLQQHLSSHHANTSGTYRDKFKESTIQTFFNHLPRYFGVNSAMKGVITSPPYTAYMEDVVPLIESIETTGAPPEANDLSPLLQQTNWHVYLAEILPNTQKVKAVTALMKTPTSARGIPWLGKILKEVIFDYMVAIRRIAKNADIRVLRLLKEFPRVAAGGGFFCAHDRDDTLNNYGTLLHKWAHAIILSVESPVDNFQLPLSSDDLARIEALKRDLKAGRKKEAVESLHILFKHIWYPRPHLSAEFDAAGKWGNIYECLIALDCLREDATFDQPANITQRFAKIEYHIRGCILYEAYQKRDQFDFNLERAVLAEGAPNLDPNTPSPYNNCLEYQALISSLAYRAGKAPTTRVSDDGMFINWKGYDFSVAAFREGLQLLADRIDTNISTLTAKYNLAIHIPDTIVDDWNDNSRGYSWTTCATFVDDPRALLKAVLNDPDQQLASVDPSGRFRWNVDKCWEFIRICDQISADLALLAFFSIGPSSRGTEFLDGSYSNGLRPRTMFHDRDGLWIITRRIKSETLTGQEAFIPKKCHPVLTRLFHQYLLLIRPLEAEIIFSLRDATVYQQYKEFLWMQSGNRLQSETFSALISQFLEKHVNTPMGLQGYRQVSVEMGRVFIGSEFLVDIEQDDALAAQSGHSARIAQGHYAVESSHLPGVSSEEILRFGYMSELWWWMTGFLPNHPPLLPRRARFKLTDAATTLNRTFDALPDIKHSSNVSASSTNPVGLSLADFQGLVDGLKATISHEIQQINVNLNERVRTALAEALSDGLMARPTTATTSSAPLIALSAIPVSQPPLPIQSSNSLPSSSIPAYTNYAAEGFDDMYGDTATYTAEEMESNGRSVLNASINVPVSTPSAPLVVSTSAPTPSLVVSTSAPTPSLVASASHPAAESFSPSLFDPRPPATAPTKQPTLPLPTSEEHQYMLGLLQRHFPNIERPRFRSEYQLLAVYHTLRRKQSFIAVMPTNAGKSLVMTLPPFHEHGYQSYVVIPNKALLTDQIKNARDHNLVVFHWSAKSRSIYRGSDIVYMAMESAGSMTFRKFWQQQEQKALRIIVDEAHQVLTEVDFRSQFEKLRLLADLGVQMVYLTASLPPRLFSAFCRALGLPLSTPIIRAPSHQPNISFNRIFYNSRTTTELRLAVDIAKLLNRQMDADQIGIIFCTDKTQARLLQEGFTACGSYSTLALDDKARFEKMWMTWTPDKVDSAGNPLPGRWIAATTTLIHGINAKNVGATIFLGMPYGMLNFYQGSGRGGRDGRKSYSILIDALDHHTLTNPSEEDWPCVQEGITWLERNECRRLGFSRLLDSTEVTCFDLDHSHMCDFCTSDRSLIDALQLLILDKAEELPMEELPYFEEDDFAMEGLDFSHIPELGPVVRPTRFAKPRQPPSAFELANAAFDGITEFPIVPPATLPLPTNTSASLQIQSEAADRHRLHEDKAEKALLIAQVAEMLRGYCVVCFLKTDQLNTKHGGQLFGKACGFGFNSWMFGWIDFKKSLQFGKYQYCFKCFLPQEEEFRAPSHGIPPLCSMSEFVIHTLWFVLHTDWNMVQKRFPAAPASNIASRPTLLHWLKQSSGDDGFWNGLEVVMWYLKQKNLY